MDKLVKELFEEHKNGEQLDSNDIAYLFAYIRDNNDGWVDGPTCDDMNTMALIEEGHAVRVKHRAKGCNPFDPAEFNIYDGVDAHDDCGILLGILARANLRALAVRWPSSSTIKPSPPSLNTLLRKNHDCSY